MKKYVLLLSTLLVLQSCVLFKKTHRQKTETKEHVDTEVVVKQDSTAKVTQDSTSTVKKTRTKTETTVDVIDTTIHLTGDSASVSGLIGSEPKEDSFEVNGKIVTVSTDPKNNSYNVKVKDRPRDVPVKMRKEKTTTVTDDSTSTVSVNKASEIKVNKSTKFNQKKDTHSKHVAKDKSTSSIPWPIVVCVIVCLVCVAAWKVYTKGWNPVAWFARPKRSN